MRKRIINFLKVHNGILQFFYLVAHAILRFWGLFLPVHDKRMIFASYGGRKFDDSPKALYDAICEDEFFRDWELIWAFAQPEQFELPRGEKIKVDTPEFFKTLLTSRVWVSNSGMDRNLGLSKKKTIDVETWHGCPIKTEGSNQNGGRSVAVRWNYKNREHGQKMRCAQSEYDLEILSQIFNAPKDDFLVCDMPRNDELARCDSAITLQMKDKVGVPKDKKVILYMPTYREYQTDQKDACYLAPPIHLDKWADVLGEDYILLFRAHYAVAQVIGLKENDFVRDVSGYPSVDELYMAADILISDYSSAFVDYSILKRPMFCFAYDLGEFSQKRGLYMNIETELPCSVDQTEDALLEHLRHMDYNGMSEKTEAFSEKYCPHAGAATVQVVCELKKRLNRA